MCVTKKEKILNDHRILIWKTLLLKYVWKKEGNVDCSDLKALRKVKISQELWI